MSEQIDSMAARILSLEKSVGFEGDFKPEAAKDVL